MPCPTCNHTIQNVGIPDRRVFWCPRCGTLTEEILLDLGNKSDPQYRQVPETPKLVERVKAADDAQVTRWLENRGIVPMKGVRCIPFGHWQDVRRCIGREKS